MMPKCSSARVCCGLILAALSSITVRAGEASLSEAAAMLTPSNYIRHIQYLADDQREGRYPGTAGMHDATEYIAGQFRAAGLSPGGPDGTYFQPFDLDALKKLDSDRATLAILGDQQSWRYGDDFVTFPFSAVRAAEGQLAFAGFGIEAPDHEYDDYAGFDAKGKVLLVLRGEPKSEDDDARFGGKTASVHATFVRKARVADEHGAVALLVVNAPGRDPEDDALYSWSTRDARTSYRVPMLHISRDTANALLAKANMPDLATLAGRLESDRASLSADMGDLRVRVDPGVSTTQTRNVIAVLEGATAPDEYIVVGAHHDHVGVSRPRNNRSGGDQIHNGADDNASGTSGVIELARVFAAGPRPRRSMIFMTFSAEELGLIGSHYYADHPSVPIDSIRAMVNFDMIGRYSQHKLEIFGGPTAPEFGPLLDKYAKKFGIDFKGRGPENPLFLRSDQASFYNKGIPVLFMFSGLHDDYHLPGDDWELIDADGAAKLLHFAHGVLWDLANMTTGPTLVTESPADESEASADAHPAPSMPRVRLGVRPDQSDEPGMLIASVSADGPAARAGMKAGDRVIRIGGKELQSMGDYFGLARDFKPGDECDVVVVRDGNEVTLKVRFDAPQSE